MTHAAAQYLSTAPLLYSTVWEDDVVLTQGLAITPDDHVLSVTSAGDNVLALVLAGARKVTAIDLNVGQLSLLELKLRAIEALAHAEFLALLGETDTHDRLALYERVRPALSAHAQAYWDGERAVLTTGITQSGKLERYFATFAREHLPRVLGPEGVRALIAGEHAALTPQVREELRALFRWYFGREHMAKEGRSQAQLAHVEEADQGTVFFARMWELLERGLGTNNPYLERFLTGSARHSESTTYLRAEHYATLRERVGRIELIHDELGAVLDGHAPHTFTKANLSDLFEYLDERHTEALFTKLADRLRPHGRLAYWTLLVDRRPSEALAARLPLAPESGALKRKDRVFFYGAFRVHTVQP